MRTEEWSITGAAISALPVHVLRDGSFDRFYSSPHLRGEPIFLTYCREKEKILLLRNY
jgi:hypothetical protein